MNRAVEYALSPGCVALLYYSAFCNNDTACAALVKIITFVLHTNNKQDPAKLSKLSGVLFCKCLTQCRTGNRTYK